MLTAAEIVWLGHDNTIDLQLTASSSAQSLNAVTKITATFGSTLVSGSSRSTGAITWQNSGWSTGEIRMDLGSQSISAGEYNVPIIVYTASYANGIVWGKVPVVVKADPEASP